MPVLTKKLEKIYQTLLKAYGRQGWWPVKGRHRLKKSVTDAHGYHPGDYSLPMTFAQQFEVAVGAILTQNTSWKNAERSIDLLIARKKMSPEAVSGTPLPELGDVIRASGYYNQKAKKLRIFADVCREKKWFDGRRVPDRGQLLALWGIGEETADSILLYAFRVPSFVVDAYTRRLLFRMGMIREKATYTDVQQLFHQGLIRDVALFNEYHALIVEHAKRSCKATPFCHDCPLGKTCDYGRRK